MNKLKLIVKALVASALVVFAGCSDISSPSSDNYSGEKAANVTLALGDVARTILPEVDLTSGYKFTVKTTASGASTATTHLENKTYTEITASNAISLDAGTYTFTVTATNETKGTTLQGSTTKAISAGSNTVSIKLADATTDGTGTVEVTLKYTKNAGVAAIYAYWGETVPSAASADTATNLYDSSNEGTATLSKTDVESGKTYYVAFYLYNSTGTLLGSCHDTVYVVAGYNSSATKSIKIAKIVGLYPENGTDSAHADTQLILTFTAAPTLVADKTVIIKNSSGTTVDTINILPSTSDETQTTQSGYTVNVGNKQLVHVGSAANGENPNSVYIQPHYGKLDWGTSYYVEIEQSAITTSGTLYGGEAWNGFSGSEGWTFTTKTEPTLSTTLTVSNNPSSTADYFSVYGAMCKVAGQTSGTYEIQIEEGTYYELVSIQGHGAHIILKGPATAQYGNDVVIEYVNNVHMNNSTHTRPSFYYKGSGNLTFENVTLKNLTQRKTVYTVDGYYGGNSSSVSNKNNYQAEALYYYCSSGFVNAYNSSFVSLQDTILTDSSKAWFYGCYIAGDVDFMWGTSNVALFEKCEIECLADSNVSTDNAYLFETRVGSTNGTTIGKGYVLLNSTVTVDSGVTAYYARRATAKSDTSYYDQVAIVNSTFSGSGSLAPARWYDTTVKSDAKEPETITDSTVYKYGPNVDVGWKEYGVTNSTATSSTTSTSNFGVMGETEYSKEYSGRRAILNRFFTKGDGSAENSGSYSRDTTTNWAVDSLISNRGYTVAADLSSESESGSATTTAIVYDFTALTGYTAQTSYVASASPTSGTGGDITLKTNGWKWHGNTYGLTASGTSPWTITVPVTGACTIAITNSYDGAPTVTLPTNVTGDPTLTANATTTYTYSGTDASNLEFSFTSSDTFYISKLTVSYTNTSGISLSIAGDTSVDIASTITLTATASSTTSGSWSWLFSTGTTSTYATLTKTTETTTYSTATLTGLTAGTVYVYAIVDGVVSDSWSVIVGATNFISASDSPKGWASYIGTTKFDGTTLNTPADSTKGTSGGYGASSSNIYTVSTKSALKTALSGDDKKIIYINGMIDMSDGMLPAKADESTSALDSWIATEVSNLTDTSEYGSVASSVSSLATWKTWYAGGCTYNANESGVYAEARAKLSKNYGNKIKVSVPSNTTIIGLTSESGIKGGTIQVVNATNVVIRNLTIQDAFDPFPQMQANDGFNAEWDAIVVQGSSYVWIDHCTMQDTIANTDSDFDHIDVASSSGSASTTEVKYQVFDGLIDIKGNSTGSVPSDFVTVSYCKIANHDKVGIIGHSDSTTYDENHLTVTLHNNYYYNCTQRLPRVRFGHVHAFNNYYQNDSTSSSAATRRNSYCFGVGKKAYIYAENNYFGDKIQYVAEMMNSSNIGYLTLVNNSGVSSLNGVSSTTATWTPSSYYSYTAATANNDLVTDVIANAGAGVWSVEQ